MTKNNAGLPEDWKPVRVGEGWKPIYRNPKNRNELWPENCRRWQVTVNLGSMPESLQAKVKTDHPEEWEECETWLKAMMPNQRWLASLEEGKEGNRHIQMIIVNDGKNPIPQKQIVEHLGHPHYEPIRSSIEANIRYVTKPSSEEKGKHLAGPWTNGDWSKWDASGTHKISAMEKLRRLCLDIDNPLVCKSFLLHDPELGAFCGLHEKAMELFLHQRVLDIQERRANQNRTCIWIWGPTKAGKSHDVELLRKMGRIGSVMRSTSQRNPFDRYEDQNTIWLEEFRGRLPIEAMLNITDKWSDVDADARYKDHPLIHENVIVTSNVPPETLYEHQDPLTQDAWLRRWTKVLEKKTKNEHPLLEYFGVPKEEWPEPVPENEDGHFIQDDPIPEIPRDVLDHDEAIDQMVADYQAREEAERYDEDDFI